MIPNWSGRAVLVVCTGPTLDIPAVRASQLPKIAVNTAYTALPEAEVHYAGDALFWRVHHARMRLAVARPCFWTVDPGASERYQVNRWKGVNRNGLGETMVHLNGNSGAQAINLAYLFGARRILVAGMTMASPDGQRHFHGDHEYPLVQSQCFDEWLHKLNAVARDAQRLGVEIINCDPKSRATMFKQGEIE